MAENHWQQLGRNQLGIAIEGDSDKVVLEAFLNAGERTGHWSDWRRRMALTVLGGSERIFRELERTQISMPHIYGLIDRDWRSEEELKQLQLKYQNLLILPRVMIENFLIDPTEIISHLPPVRKSLEIQTQLKSEIGTKIQLWLRQGALAQALYQKEAHYFCRTSDGYPEKLLSQPPNDSEIRESMRTWIKKLDGLHPV